MQSKHFINNSPPLASWGLITFRNPVWRNKRTRVAQHLQPEWITARPGPTMALVCRMMFQSGFSCSHPQPHQPNVQGWCCFAVLSLLMGSRLVVRPCTVTPGNTHAPGSCCTFDTKSLESFTEIRTLLFLSSMPRLLRRHLLIFHHVPKLVCTYGQVKLLKSILLHSAYQCCTFKDAL